MLAPRLVCHPVALCRPLEAILVEEFGSLQFLALLVQTRSKGSEFGLLQLLDERPKLPGVQGHATPYLVGASFVVMAGFIEK